MQFGKKKRNEHDILNNAFSRINEKVPTWSDYSDWTFWLG